MNNIRRIFICGIHGVGKSTFTKNSKELQKYTMYACSQLIKNYSGLEFENKKVTSSSHNQDVLLKAVDYYVREEFVLFDGHIVLFNKNDEIEIIDLSVLKSLNIQHIIFLKASPSVIYERLCKRERETWLTLELIERAQNIEEQKVMEYTNLLCINYTIYEWNEETNQWMVS